MAALRGCAVNESGICSEASGCRSLTFQSLARPGRTEIGWLREKWDPVKPFSCVLTMPEGHGRT